MKLICICLSAFSLLITMSCTKTYRSNYNDAVTFTYDDFKTTQRLKGKTLTFDSLIMKPTAMYVHDSLLIISNTGTEKIFHLFNLKTGKQIGQRINTGQGPDEMIMPFFVQNESALILYDLGTSTVSKFDIGEFISSPKPMAYERFKLSEQIMGGIVIAGNQIIGSPYNPQYPFSKFDSKGNKTGTFGAYPESDITYSDIEITGAYYSGITSNPDGKVAVCYFWTDLIDIYNNDGTLEKRIHGPEHYYPRFEGVNDGNMSFSRAIPGKARDAYYYPTTVGEDFFVCFNGKTMEEEGYNINAGHIFVFGWDGTPKKVFELDQEVTRITVNPKSKKIYGINDDPDYRIIEFSYE